MDFLNCKLPPKTSAGGMFNLNALLAYTYIEVFVYDSWGYLYERRAEAERSLSFFLCNVVLSYWKVSFVLGLSSVPIARQNHL